MILLKANKKLTTAILSAVLVRAAMRRQLSLTMKNCTQE